MKRLVFKLCLMGLICVVVVLLSSQQWAHSTSGQVSAADGQPSLPAESMIQMDWTAGVLIILGLSIMLLTPAKSRRNAPVGDSEN